MTDALLDQIEQVLRVVSQPRPKMHTHGEADVPEVCAACDWADALGEIELDAPKWLQALVGRLRSAESENARLLDVLDDFAHAAHAVLDGPCYVGTTDEMIAAARHRLAVFAGRYDRPVTATNGSGQ